MVCGSGNLSFRVTDDRMLISAAGAWLAELSQDQVAICRVSDGVSITGICLRAGNDVDIVR